MKCFNCGLFALFDLCEDCVAELGEFSLGVRELESDFKVYSFYKYQDIKHLIYSKHKFYGYFVFNALARISFAQFHNFFAPQHFINAVALDDKVENGLYSHSAILAKHLKTQFIKPLYRVLHSRSKVKYSGQSIQFRQKHKREYELLKMPQFPVILVDDIVTTGLSLIEAKQILEKNKISVLFALVLADAKD